MTSNLNRYGEYAQFIFNLLATRSSIVRHTISVFTKSQTIGMTRGRVVFRTGHVLRVFEQVDFVTHRIISYFYEFTLAGEPLWWYDSMPHPEVEELQSSHTHPKIFHLTSNITGLQQQRSALHVPICPY